jgi:predicted RNA binding protein YcfA (HicA-like mRNA interferase family)
MMNLTESFGFSLHRVNGRHPVFVHPDVPGRVTLQGVRGRLSHYQIKQFLRPAEKYNLILED